MIRVLLVMTFSMGSPVASAADGLEYQRRAMTAVVTQWSPATPRDDVRAFVDAELKQDRAMSTLERSERLARTAKLLATATDETLRRIRANDLEGTRTSLNEVLRLLLRASRLDKTPSREEIGSTSFGYFVGAFAGGVVAGLGTMFAGMPIHSGGMVFGGACGAMASLCAMIPLGFLERRSHDWNLPGAKHIAQRFSRTEERVQFWSQVREHMKEDGGEVYSAEDLGRVIGSELEGITLEQACTSALLLPPPNK